MSSSIETVSLVELINPSSINSALDVQVSAQRTADMAKVMLKSLVEGQDAAASELKNQVVALDTTEVWVVTADGRDSPVEVLQGRVLMLSVQGLFRGIQALNTQDFLGSVRQEWHHDIEPCVIIYPDSEDADWGYKAVPLKHGQIRPTPLNT